MSGAKTYKTTTSATVFFFFGFFFCVVNRFPLTNWNEERRCGFITIHFTFISVIIVAIFNRHNATLPLLCRPFFRRSTKANQARQQTKKTQNRWNNGLSFLFNVQTFKIRHNFHYNALSSHFFSHLLWLSGEITNSYFLSQCKLKESSEARGKWIETDSVIKIPC